MITVHGEGTVKREIAWSIDNQPWRDPYNINGSSAGVAVVSGLRGGRGVFGENCIREAKGSEISRKPAGSNIRIAVNANHNIIPSFQGGGNSYKKINIKIGGEMVCFRGWYAN